MRNNTAKLKTVSFMYGLPSSSLFRWTDLFEEELSAAQTSGLEMIIIGDINIDYHACKNCKWLNLVNYLT